MLTTLLLFAQIAHASPAAPKTYILDVQATQNGKLVSFVNGEALEDEKVSSADPEDHSLPYVDVVAQEQTPGSVLLDLEVGTIDAKGKKTATSHPRIIALENEPAAISDEKAGEKTTVSVLVRPHTL